MTPEEKQEATKKLVTELRQEAEHRAKVFNDPNLQISYLLNTAAQRLEKAEKLYVEKVFENREKKVEKATLKSLKHAHAKMQV